MNSPSSHTSSTKIQDNEIRDLFLMTDEVRRLIAEGKENLVYRVYENLGYCEVDLVRVRSRFGKKDTFDHVSDYLPAYLNEEDRDLLINALESAIDQFNKYESNRLDQLRAERNDDCGEFDDDWWRAEFQDCSIGGRSGNKFRSK